MIHSPILLERVAFDRVRDLERQAAHRSLVVSALRALRAKRRSEAAAPTAPEPAVAVSRRPAARCCPSCPCPA